MPANVVKIVDLGGGGDFSSTAAFVAWLYANYPTLDRNFRCVCRSAPGYYADTASWGTFPTVPANYIVLFQADEKDWFDGRFVSNRYHLMAPIGTISPSRRLAWYRIQFGRPDSHYAYAVYGLLFYCGVVSQATTTVVFSARVHSSIIIASYQGGTPAGQIIIVDENQVQHGGLVTSSLVVNKGTLFYGIRCDGGTYGTIIANTIIDGVTVAVGADTYDVTYYNATTCSSITPNTLGNRVSQTFTYVDPDNYNYILDWDDTGAKGYGHGLYGGGLFTLNMADPYGLRFDYTGRSIGPTEPEPPEPIPWVIKTVNTDGGGDFSSLGAANAWIGNNYPNLVTANVRIKLICAGTTLDTSNFSSNIVTDVWRYIHVVARDDFYYKGDPNGSYFRWQPTTGAEVHVIWEGIRVYANAPWKSYIYKNCWVGGYDYTGSTWAGVYYCCLFQRGASAVIYNYASFANSTVIQASGGGISRPTYWAPSENCIIITSGIGGGTSAVEFLGIATNGGAALTGKYSLSGLSIAFVNASEDDYRLLLSDTAVARQGLRLKRIQDGDVDIEGYYRPFRVSYGMDESILVAPTEQCKGQTWESRVWLEIDICKGQDQAYLVKLVEIICRVADLGRKVPLFGRVMIKMMKPLVKVVKL